MQSKSLQHGGVATTIPDLNPIEHVWDKLETKLESYKPKNLTELEERIKDEWCSISVLMYNIYFRACLAT